MIRLQRPVLVNAIPDGTVRAELAARALGATTLSPNTTMITSRWNSFVAGTGRNKAVGPVVCRAIRAYCREKCAYCEAPKAATVDHVWPKSDYPARMFDWDNLVAACRDCNSSKRSGFPFDAQGNPLQLDPTSDEPLDHFRWNHLTGECECDPQSARALHTFGAFEMNRLARERLEKLNDLRFFFFQTIGSKVVPGDLRDRIRAALDADRPYLCILRSYLLYPPDARERLLIKAAVTAVPEIHQWVQPWLLPPAGVPWPP